MDQEDFTVGAYEKGMNDRFYHADYGSVWSELAVCPLASVLTAHNKSTNALIHALLSLFMVF